MNQFDLDQLAKLSCLEITAEERERLIKDMEAIAAFAAGLPSADDVSFDVEDALDVSSLRQDVCADCLEREALLASAHSKRDGYITVPRVWKEER
jgi:aspartyl/glutamyl-tRNA(Asn/Gln) amidotransferase C subunit